MLQCFPHVRTQFPPKRPFCELWKKPGNYKCKTDLCCFMFREVTRRRKHLMIENLLQIGWNGIWLVCVCVCVWFVSFHGSFLKESCSSPPGLISCNSPPCVTALIALAATENEFLLNAKVTITHPSSNLPSLSPFPSIVSAGRQTAAQPIAIRAAVCQQAFKWSPVSH